MTVEFNVRNKDWKTFIIVYATNEDEKAEVNNVFWEELTLIMEVCRGKVFVIGDFNGRVGRADDVYGEVVGKHGEDTRNNNGRRLLEFCQLNNLIITNTFYSHKNIHKYTKEVPSRNEKSIIDYILVQRDNRRAIKDVKVRRGAEIGSDRYLLVATIKELKLKSNTGGAESRRKVIVETIRSYKLKEDQIAEKYKEMLEKEIQDSVIEEMWKIEVKHIESDKKSLWNN